MVEKMDVVNMILNNKTLLFRENLIGPLNLGGKSKNQKEKEQSSLYTEPYSSAVYTPLT